jgi:ribonuclease Z
MTWHLLFVGTGGFHSMNWKGNPCMMLSASGARFMFDCGDGSAVALHRLDAFSDVDLVLLSGGTAEEISGLPLLGNRIVFKRSSRRPLAIVCPRNVGPRLDMLAALKRGSPVPFQWRELDDGDLAFENSTLEIRAFGLNRDDRDPGLGYVVQERPLRPRVDMEAAARLGVNEKRAIDKLIEGKPVDGVQPSQVVGPPRPGRKVVIAGRTRPCPELLSAIADADIAAVAAAYIDERLDIAHSSKVLTGWEAAEIANQNRVKTLALYNTSASNSDRVLLAESSQYHDDVFIPHDGDRIDLAAGKTRRAPEIVRVGRSRKAPPSRSSRRFRAPADDTRGRGGGQRRA